MINTIYNSDTNILAQQAADAFARDVHKVLAIKDEVVVAIPGGGSITDFFSALQKNTGIDWKKIHFFMLDERLVDLESKDSNFHNAYQNLFINLVDSKKISWSNLHPFVYKPQDKDSGAFFYNEELKQFGSKYDIVIAGVGADGHIGAIFPNHPVFDNNESNFITLKDSPKPPQDRMTSSVDLIKSARFAFAFFINEGKRQAYDNFLSDLVEKRACPAKILTAIEELHVVTDMKIKNQ